MSLLYALCQVVDHKEPLIAVSRLDQCTEGLLFVAKNPEFAAFYNRLLRAQLPDGQPSIRKCYRALSKFPPPNGLSSPSSILKGAAGTACGLDSAWLAGLLACLLRRFLQIPCISCEYIDLGRLTDPCQLALILQASYMLHKSRLILKCPTGLLTHYLCIGQRVEGQPLHTAVHTDNSSGGKLSQLEVMGVQQVTLQPSLTRKYGELAYESQIRLITGRTHQVRYLPTFKGTQASNQIIPSAVFLSIYEVKFSSSLILDVSDIQGATSTDGAL